MIRYALACDQAHEFESWFPSADSFDEQAARGFVACPVCGSTTVEKRLMTPSISRKDRAPQQAAPGAAPAAETPAPVALLSERERAMRAMLREIREHVVRNSEDVGDRFVEEARKIHYGEADERSIYGQATLDDARDLMEEGVAVQPLPNFGDDRN
ncbi:MAG: DUF1178 family protein [Salinarimonadaceae bacterium]|nr:MAG: DUF1178 family protein [Salinarimonadaceae bacterium]TVR10683.1 MAG: DUF1178 family protein [Salinarimonadaceae bacterium]